MWALTSCSAPPDLPGDPVLGLCTMVGTKLEQFPGVPLTYLFHCNKKNYAKELDVMLSHRGVWLGTCINVSWYLEATLSSVIETSVRLGKNMKIEEYNLIW